MVNISVSLVELLSIGGFLLGALNLILLWTKHRKDKPVVRIEKKIYLKHRKFHDMNPREYAQKVLRGEFNNGVLNYEVRELVVNITNLGNRDAKLKGVLPLYETKGNPFSPKVINFFSTTIMAGDREEIHLFFEFPKKKIKELENTLPNTIDVEFDFAHKKINERFHIGNKSFGRIKSGKVSS